MAPPRVVLGVQNLGVPRDPRVWREACTLRDAGYAVSVIAPREDRQPLDEVLDGIRILRYRTAPSVHGPIGTALDAVVGLLQTARRLARLRLAGPVAVFHTANPPDTVALLGLLLRASRTRYVYDQHDACPELLEAQLQAMAPAQARALGPVARPVVRWLERLSYRCADLVVLPNDSYRRIACTRGGVRPDAAVTVRSGPDRVEPAGERERTAGDALVVAFAGVMGPQDRVEVLLDAAAEVLRLRPGAARLELVGDGDDRPRLQRRSRALGLDEAVTWTGWLSRDDLRARLRGADVAVSLDGDDAFSRISTMTKVTDYLAHGLPSVIADLPENRVTAADAALYFDPGDPAALAKRLVDLVDDPSLLGSLAGASRRRAPSLLWRESAPRLEGAYRWLLHGGPPVVPGDQPVIERPPPA